MIVIKGSRRFRFSRQTRHKLARERNAVLYGRALDRWNRRIVKV